MNDCTSWQSMENPVMIMRSLFDSTQGKAAYQILRTLVSAGYDAYLVGGCVRNVLLGLPIVDFDITTSARPEIVARLFPHTVETGIRFGTVTVIHEAVHIEVTTFRSERKYLDTRHPSEVQFETSILADLQRRDFTMNAIACSLLGELVDPYGGVKDINERTIRGVGNPMERMREDLLRCVRAFRFMAQLGFAIDASTFEAIASCSDKLEQIARERVGVEWRKMISAAHSIPLQQLADTGWLRVFDLSYRLEHLPKWQVFVNCYKNMTDEAAQLALLARLLNKTEQEFGEWLRSLRYGRETVATGRQILACSMRLQIECTDHERSGDQTFIFLKDMLFAYGLQIAIQGVHIHNQLHPAHRIDETRVRDVCNAMPIHNSKQLQLDGRDLLPLAGGKGGPWIGQMLQELAMGVLHGHLPNQRQQLMDWAKTQIAERKQNGTIQS
ncbi:CCA tRNA nucleotidyltransferase [Fodinisporobacter ferrooxydans]|uniref:CCA tRNA nucleotidyltransferase n=1 Tax=Fodinisporobacter ferrooxydans TaxID=2901836 RepID=A0ABY4CH60_9BACL|nr:CCA tRNA nucleotidyltransferase [Alicyclobacillaceae bacterium MYW30-H2]